MMGFYQRKLEVVQCDNGFAVEWRDENLAATDSEWMATGSRARPATNGVLIFKTKKELLDYVGSFYAGR
jgi:hypothetical protein